MKIALKDFLKCLILREIDFTDFSSNLNLEKALKTLRNIRRVCRRRCEGAFTETRKEIVLPSENLKIR